MLSKANLTILKKKMKLFRVKLRLQKKTSTNLFINHKKLNERIIEMKRNMRRLEQYSRREYIEIAGILSRRTNDLLKEHGILIFKKL